MLIQPSFYLRGHRLPGTVTNQIGICQKRSSTRCLIQMTYVLFRYLRLSQCAVLRKKKSSVDSAFRPISYDESTIAFSIVQTRECHFYNIYSDDEEIIAI